METEGKYAKRKRKVNMQNGNEKVNMQNGNGKVTVNSTRSAGTYNKKRKENEYLFSIVFSVIVALYYNYDFFNTASSTSSIASSTATKFS